MAGFSASRELGIRKFGNLPYDFSNREESTRKARTGENQQLEGAA